MDRGDSADDAGVEESDIILAVDARAVDAPHDLATSIHRYRPGDEVVLTILRQGEETEIIELKVALGRDQNEEGEIVTHLGVRYRPLGTEFCLLPLERDSQD